MAIVITDTTRPAKPRSSKLTGIAASQSGASSQSVSGGSFLDPFFTIDEVGNITCLANLFSRGEMAAFVGETAPIPNWWASMPFATASSVGGFILGSGLAMTNGVLSVDGSIGQGFDEAANYNPSGAWNFTGTLKKGGVDVSLANHNHDGVYKAASYVPAWSEISGKPSTFTPSAHSHGIGDVTNLQSTLNGKAALNGASDVDFSVRNLSIYGEVSNIVSSTIIVDDAFVQVNTGNAAVDAGFIADNGTALGARLYWRVSDSKWVFGNNGSYEVIQPLIAAGTTSQYYRGDKTWQTLNTAVVAESTNLYYTDARVRACVLTGYAAGSNTALAATDSILAAMGKIQGQINARLLSSSYTAADVLAKLLTVDGAGTGLDADLLDGYHSSSFPRKDETATISVTWTFTSNQRIAADNSCFSIDDSTSNMRLGFVKKAGSLPIYACGSAAAHIWSIASVASITAVSTTTFTELMRLNSTGLGIGVTPTQKLHVSGNILASGEVTAYSDIRLKTNLIRIESALDKICQLTGYTYDKDGKRSAGLIAQEVKKILPEAVHGKESKDNYLSVNDAGVTGLIVEAIKELTSELNQLKTGL